MTRARDSCPLSQNIYLAALRPSTPDLLDSQSYLLVVPKVWGLASRLMKSLLWILIYVVHLAPDSELHKFSRCQMMCREIPLRQTLCAEWMQIPSGGFISQLWNECIWRSHHKSPNWSQTTQKILSYHQHKSCGATDAMTPMPIVCAPELVPKDTVWSFQKVASK